MGFHICEWCQRDPDNGLNGAHVYRPSSSQDVTLKFDNGHIWQFPHVGLLHYVTSHGYRPPEEFILDVMTREIAKSEMVWTKGVQIPTKVGYLVYPDLEQGYVPDGFVEKLSNIVWPLVRDFGTYTRG
jgi:hypothetical protein